MQHKPLQHVLKSHFALDPRRLDFIAAFILALIKVRTVNLTQIGTALNGFVQPASNAKRAKRFLDFDLLQETISQFVLSFINNPKLVLTMDRTNWKFGSISINFLVIAIAVGGVAIPVAWKNLGKEGNSNQAERKTILEKLLKIIPAHRILALTAARVARQVPSYEQEDREFIGCDWFQALFEQEVNPVIRLKRDTMIQHREIKAPADAWFDHLKAGEILELTKARVMGVRVFVLATMTPEGEFLILATRKRPSQALAIDAQRWEIETLFAAFKTRGFNLEDTHVMNLERSERLFALLVVALVWVVLTGEFVSSLKRLKLKNHGWPERSVFRVGLDCLRQILLSGRSGKFVLDDVISLLSSS
jgi:Transposase DDE domain